MKKFLICVVIFLSGCSSFKLGGMVYCPHGQECQFKQNVPINK